MCDLQWQQIELSEGRLHVHRVKNGIPSVHPIRGDEIRALRQLRRDYLKDAYVFVSERGGPISPFADKVLPARFTRVAYDVPARSATVLAREASIIDRFRSLGHPFAKTVSRDPVVDDAAHVMDVTFLVDPGPTARIGEVAVRGTQAIDPAASLT